MKILFLGPEKKPQNTLVRFLSNDGNSVTRHGQKLKRQDIDNCAYDFLVSFGYCYIVNREILDYFKSKAINLHISYLPWNKGADSNLWSILEKTPKGVTIHQMDYGLDTGQILSQKKISFDEDSTLKSSYDKLQSELVKLFKSVWMDIRHNKLLPKRQKGTGSYHKSTDKNSYLDLLHDGWNTRIKDLEGKAVNA